MTVPYSFGTATSAIPLSQLDSNFNTPITLGNTAIQLGNTVTTLNNMTLANVTISSGNVTLTNVSVTTANVATANIATSIITSSETLSYGTANGVAYLNGSKVVTTGSALVFDGTNLGIGTSSPTGKLQVKGTVNFEATNSTNVWNLYTFTDNTLRWNYNGAGADELVLDSSGNLGLGVTPSAWASSSAIQMAGGQGYSRYGVANNAYYDGANYRYISTAAATLYGNSTGSHLWFTAASGTAGNAITFTQAMTLDASGNLQIGNTSYAYRVAASRASDGIVGYFRRDGSTVNPALTISCNETGNTVGFGTDYAGATSPAMTFSTQGTERARIDSSGNLLVGTTSASGRRLWVAGSNTGYISTIQNDNSSPLGLQIYHPTDVNGTGNSFLVCVGNATNRVELRSNGGIGNYSANDVNLSDRREKTNFAPAKSYLDTICAIPVQTFNYIDQNLEEDAGLTLGVVAQDVQAVAPELVMESNWGTAEEPKMRLSIYQTDLQYALMKCIQEQQALITALTARVAALEAK